MTMSAETPYPSSDSTVIVEIPTATIPSRVQVVLGQESKTNGLEEFRGIPYGRTKARWEHSAVRASLPFDVFDARRNGPRCPQPAEQNNTVTFQAHLDFPLDVDESEFDCLNLFIVRPKQELACNILLPVYFYIHGGGYGFGAGTDPMWDPTALVARSVLIGKPIIAVNINYRLNIFGFGCSDEIIVAQDPTNLIKGGNFGLGDQRRALEWVVRNIGYFGGDKTRITIGGQSAGGSSAHAHVLDARLNCDKAKPLFRRAIIQSGAVGTLGPIALSKANANFELPRSEYPGLDIERLRKIPADVLVKKTKELGWWVFPLVNDGLTIKPTKVGRWQVCLGYKDAILDEQPCKDTREPLRVMIGDADDDASIWSDNVRHIKDYAQLKGLIRPNVTEDVWTQLAELYHFDASAPLSQIHTGLTQLLTDVEFGNPVHIATSELSSTCASEQTDTYPTSTHSFRCRFGNPWAGSSFGLAHHCVDLIYVFNCFDTHIIDADRLISADQAKNNDLVHMIQQNWLDFIYDDSPSLVEEGKVLVYGKNFSATIVDSRDDKEVQARLSRFRFINAHLNVVSTATRLITGVSVA